MGLARPFPGVRLKSGTDLLSKGLQDNYEEDREARYKRECFERSHNFKEGDEVIILKCRSLPSVYIGMLGMVTRSKTFPGTGPCISVKAGGNTINFGNPNDELLAIRSKITRYLYK